MSEVFPAPKAPGGWSEGRTNPSTMSSYQPWLHWWRGQGGKSKGGNWQKEPSHPEAFTGNSLFHIYFLAMLRKRKIDMLISPAHFPGPSGAEAEMTYHCEEGEDVTAFTNSCGRKIIILKVCGLYKPYLLSQTTRKLISDTKHLILSNQ